MFIRVKHSPEEMPEDHPFDEMRVEATRFMDDRYQSCYNLLHEISDELAQVHDRLEVIEKRLRKYEPVEDWQPALLPDRESNERVSL